MGKEALVWPWRKVQRADGGHWENPAHPVRAKQTSQQGPIYPEDTILRYLRPGGGGGAEDSVGDAVDTGLRVQRGVGGRAGEAAALAGVHRGVGGEGGHQAGHPLAPGGSDPPGGGEARLSDASLLLRCRAPLLGGGARARPAHGGELTREYGARPWTWGERDGLRRRVKPASVLKEVGGGRYRSSGSWWVSP